MITLGVSLLICTLILEQILLLQGLVGLHFKVFTN
jgi:hypothetical protein